MYICPDCLKPAALKVVESLELPSDARSDDITLQLCACEACGLQVVAVYQESRRGALDSESWEYFGYRLSPERFRELQSDITSCPNQRERKCQCAAHRRLGRHDQNGYWIHPYGIAGRPRFPMKR